MIVTTFSEYLMIQRAATTTKLSQNTGVPQHFTYATCIWKYSVLNEHGSTLWIVWNVMLIYNSSSAFNTSTETMYYTGSSCARNPLNLSYYLSGVYTQQTSAMVCCCVSGPRNPYLCRNRYVIHMQIN